MSLTANRRFDIQNDKRWYAKVFLNLNIVIKKFTLLLEIKSLLAWILSEIYYICSTQDEDITQSMIKVDNPEATTLYNSTQLQMDFRKCNGNLYKSCILGLMSFNLTKQIQQCTDGMFIETL